MKAFLGAIAAALLFGAGCAHNREVAAQSRPASASAQASAGAMDCEVIGTGGSGQARSQVWQEGDSQQGAVSGQATQVPHIPSPVIPDVPATEAPDVSASVPPPAPLPEEDVNAGALSGGAVEPAPQEEAIGGSASEGEAISGGAVQQPLPQAEPLPQPEPQEEAIGGAAREGDAFEDTGMGSGGGGGG